MECDMERVRREFLDGVTDRLPQEKGVLDEVREQRYKLGWIERGFLYEFRILRLERVTRLLQGGALSCM